MKQRIYILFLGLIIYSGSIAIVSGQNRETHPTLSSIAISQTTPGWVHFREDLNLRPKTVFEEFKTAFSLRESESMVLQKTDTDDLGYTHYRYQLHHNGIPVEGAEYILHAKDGIARKANGFIPVDMNIPSVPQVDANQAFDIAIDYMGAEAYMWEKSGNEDALKHAHKDEMASFMPEAELMIATTSFDSEIQEYRLVWKLDIYAEKPHSRKWIYVDASDGTVVKDLETLHTSNAVGIAETKYSGTQSIVTDSLGPNSYRLQESKRGESATYSGVDIETYDLNEAADFTQAVDFFDDDNIWDNVNPELDEAATDAHWGTEMTHDYFFQHFGHSSFDNNGSPMISYVHFGVDFFNAFWNGSWMTYGDGNDAPLISLDVVAHEFAHGLTQNSADLVYAFEPGALNESFSDIFGNAIEQFATPALADWRVGEGFGFSLRNMANPNQFGDPDTYKGTFWKTGTGDNGGVHSNSGVQNFWFYLLVEGGTGVNDNGQTYDVPALGWEAAAQIAYRNLTSYLTPNSQFADARAGALEATNDLFGFCSIEYVAVAEAWFAVGVGPKILSGDLGVLNVNPVAVCGRANDIDEDFISVEIGYFGCDTFPGGQVPISYTVSDPSFSATEIVTLPQMSRESSYTYQFGQALPRNQPGSYLIYSEINDPNDTNTFNDTSSLVSGYRIGYFTNEQVDFENFASSTSVLDSIYLGAEEQASIGIFWPVGKDFSYGVRMEGGNVADFQVLIPENADPADFNTEHQARTCMCMDATHMDSLSISFDLKQNFSPYWANQLGDTLDSIAIGQRVNILRVMADDQEIARFSPASYKLDPWVNHSISLDSLVGESFNLCFLATLNLSRTGDVFSVGDLVSLDNINFSSVSSTISSIAPAFTMRELQAYPNPTSNHIAIDYEASQNEPLRLRVFNPQGQLVLQRSWDTKVGINRLDLSLGHLPEGIYSLYMQDEKGGLSKKIIVEK